MKYLTALILILHVAGLAWAEDLTIGALFPLTGPAAQLGAGNQLGAQIAVDEINEAGGIRGRKLRLILEDSKSDPATGVAAFRKLIDVDQVSLVLTTLTSVSLAIRPIADSRKVLILAESTHPDLIKASRFVFRNFVTMDALNELLIKYLAGQSIHKLAVLHAEEDWGQAALSELLAHQSGSTFTVVSSESFAKSASDLKPQILRLLSHKPEALYLVGFGPAAALGYRQLAELRVSIPLVGNIVCGQPDVFQAIRNTDLKVISVDMALDKDNPIFRNLAVRNKKQNSGREVDQEVVTGYDGVRIFAEAMDQVGPESTKVRDFLLRKGKFSGASGEIVFSADGDSRRSLSVMVASKDGCFVH